MCKNKCEALTLKRKGPVPCAHQLGSACQFPNQRNKNRGDFSNETIIDKLHLECSSRASVRQKVSWLRKTWRSMSFSTKDSTVRGNKRKLVIVAHYHRICQKKMHHINYPFTKGLCKLLWFMLSVLWRNAYFSTESSEKEGAVSYQSSAESHKPPAWFNLQCNPVNCSPVIPFLSHTFLDIPSS